MIKRQFKTKLNETMASFIWNHYTLTSRASAQTLFCYLEKKKRENEKVSDNT